MRWFLAAVALTGCNWVLDLRGTRAQDAGPTHADAAVDGPGCSDLVFGNPMPIMGGPQDSTMKSPTLAGALDLVFTDPVGANPAQVDIFSAHRASAADAFGTPTAVAALDSAQDETDPSFSGDGLDVIFIRGFNTLLEARRGSVTSAFSSPTPVMLTQAVDAGGGGIELSWDGMTLYYSTFEQQWNVHAVTRARIDQPFGPPGPVLAPNAQWMTISPDQLEIYYIESGSGSIFRGRRASTDVPFGSFEMYVANADDPDIVALPGGLQVLLYVDSASGSIEIATRQCR